MQEDIDKITTQLRSIARRSLHLNEPPDKIEETDNGAGVVTTYVGYSGVGTLTTANKTWLIMKIVETTAGLVVTTEKKYANACLKKDQAYDDRASLTYGYLQKGL